MKNITLSYQPIQNISNIWISPKQIRTIKDLLSFINSKRQFNTKQIVSSFKTVDSKQQIDLMLQKLYLELQALPLPIQLQVLYQDNTFAINSDTKLTIDYFKIIKKIGSGTYSQVYLAEAKYNYKKYGIKVINKKKCLEIGQANYIINQIQALKQLNDCSQILRLYFAFQDTTNVYIVLEYCPAGDLFYFIKTRPSIPESQIKHYFKQIVLSFIALHQKGYIYRDLKPENILIDRNGFLRLSDFGFAIKNTGKLIFQYCGSFEYMAPQMIMKKGYSKSYDLYTLGILIYEMLTGKTPFSGQNKHNIKQFVNKQIQYPSSMSLLAQNLIKSLTNKNPEQRLGVKDTKQILLHDWFKNMNKIARQTPKIIKRKQIPVQQVFLSNKDNLKRGLNLEIQYNYMKPIFEPLNQKIGPKIWNHKKSSKQ